MYCLIFLDISARFGLFSETKGKNKNIKHAFLQMYVEDGIRQGVKQGIRQGIRQGKAADILHLLRQNGGEVKKELSDKIRGQQDEAILQRWLLMAAKAENVEQFEKNM